MKGSGPPLGVKMKKLPKFPPTLVYMPEPEPKLMGLVEPFLGIKGFSPGAGAGLLETGLVKPFLGIKGFGPGAGAGLLETGLVKLFLGIKGFGPGAGAGLLTEEGIVLSIWSYEQYKV
jgi:hypothetical protein